MYLIAKGGGGELERGEVASIILGFPIFPNVLFSILISFLLYCNEITGPREYVFLIISPLLICVNFML